MNEIFVTRIFLVCMLVLLGWLHMRQNKLEDKLSMKVDKEDFDELKNDMKAVRENVVDLKVDSAKCLTILQNLNKNSSNNS